MDPCGALQRKLQLLTIIIGLRLACICQVMDVHRRLLCRKEAISWPLYCKLLWSGIWDQWKQTQAVWDLILGLPHADLLLWPLNFATSLTSCKMEWDTFNSSSLDLLLQLLAMWMNLFLLPVVSAWVLWRCDYFLKWSLTETTKIKYLASLNNSWAYGLLQWPKQ